MYSEVSSFFKQKRRGLVKALIINKIDCDKQSITKKKIKLSLSLKPTHHVKVHAKSGNIEKRLTSQTQSQHVENI